MSTSKPRTDVLHGKSFGEAGAYERLSGVIHYAVRVDNPHNARIVDLPERRQSAAWRSRILREFCGCCGPRIRARATARCLLEIPNRGRPRIISLIDGGDPDLARDVGDAWLLRKGFTIVSVGWQWDAPGPEDLKLFAPIAREGGKRITGLLRGDLMLSHEMPTRSRWDISLPGA